MKIVTPYEITASDILYNTVTAPAVYDSGDTYIEEESIVTQSGYSWETSSGNFKIISFTDGGLFFGSGADTPMSRKEFLFIGADRTTHDAPMLPPFRRIRDSGEYTYTLNSAEWIEQGTANYLKAFDSAYGLNQEYPANTYTYDADGQIQYVVRLPGPVTAIAVMGAKGTNVRVAKYDAPYSGTPTASRTDIYNEALAKLYPSYSTDYYATLPLGALMEQDVVLTGLTGLAAGDDLFIQVQNTASGGAAAVSNIVLGYEHDFGVTLADLRISDASRSNTDFASDSFTFVPRAPGKVLDVDVKLPGSSDDTSEFQRMQRLLSDHINRACLYIPDETRPEFNVFGMHRTPFEIIGRAAGHTFASLTVEST